MLLNYRDGREWHDWLAAYPILAAVWGTLILALVACHIWSKMIYGLRWSNLTHRGIVTNGPYRFTKHPDYLSKSMFWWLIHMPLLSVEGPGTAVYHVAPLIVVNLISFYRAKTEEWHLMQDPDYRAYAAWIDRYGAIARLRTLGARLLRLRNPVAARQAP